MWFRFLYVKRWQKTGPKMNRTLPEGLVTSPIRETTEKLAWFLDKTNLFRHTNESARINLFSWRRFTGNNYCWASVTIRLGVESHSCKKWWSIAEIVMKGSPNTQTVVFFRISCWGGFVRAEVSVLVSTDDVNQYGSSYKFARLFISPCRPSFCVLLRIGTHKTQMLIFKSKNVPLECGFLVSRSTLSFNRCSKEYNF